MKKLLSILVLSSILFGCSKSLPCEINSTGTLKAVSVEIEPYYTYVNDNFIGVSGAATITRFDNIPKGVTEVKFINENDYNIVYTSTINIISCQESAVQF
jgi:hypothetical protein